MSGEIVTAKQEWAAHWPTVLAAAIGMSFTTLYVYSAGALVQPLEAEFGWSRADIGLGITVLTFTGALLGPVMGMVIDRVGSRRLAVPGIFLFCASFAAISFAGPSLWSWWLLWGWLAIAGIGVKPAIWTSAVAGLFKKGRGLALAGVFTGTSLGAIGIPLATEWLIVNYGWRGVFTGLSLIWLIIGFPFIYFGLRGALDKQREGKIPTLPRDPDTAQALRAILFSRTFISLVLAAMSFTLIAMALILSMIPILSSQGISRATAGTIAATLGLTSIIGRFATGWLLDRFDPRVISATSMALPIISLLLLIGFPGDATIALVAALILGLALGAEVDAVAFLVGHYFGTKNYGLLFGTTISGLSISSGTAPWLSGKIYDLTGAYTWVLIGGIPLCLLATLLIATLGKPPKAA